MAKKTEQLQIRVTVKRPPDEQVAAILRALAHGRNVSFTLAALNDLLAACPPVAFAETVGDSVFTPSLVGACSSFLQNYVAAMVEQAAQQKKVSPPVWAHDIPPLREPYFATELRSLRPHLIATSPVAFKRRNLFVDSAVGDRA